MDGGASRDHLEFDADPAQMLQRTRTTRAAIGDRRKGLAVPFLIGLIERVLESRGDRMIVLGDDKDETAPSTC